MNNERWTRLNEVFDEAIALPREERDAYLASACGGQEDLRAQVERLVRAHERVDPRVDSPTTLVAALLARDATPSIDSGSRFGPYRVVKEVARGGMGTVYLAERADGQYQQRVALKLVTHGFHSELLRRRFRSERQILASLEHPNIARLLDGGTTDDGLPYLVMEYIEGEPINGYVRQQNLSLRERLDLFVQICDAVAYAHSRQVVHRDIKPGNILVTPPGVPKLVDFGIAKMLEPSSSNESSDTSIRILTPEYASPEQVEGRAATEASDVYSLGVVLYELLTDHSPYAATAGNPIDLAEEIRKTAPRKPSAVLEKTVAARQLRGDLDTIVLTALRKEPERRYGSAATLAADVRHYLRSEPIQARADTLAYRTGKFVRRNRTAVVAAGVTALLATAVVALVLVTLSSRGSRASLGAAPARAAGPVLAVGNITDAGAGPREHLGAVLGDMLAINLGRVPGLRMVSTARMYEMKALLDSVRRSASSSTAAAARAGAGELLRGTVHHTNRGLRLDLERIDVKSGTVRARYELDGASQFQLVDRATARIAQDLGASAEGLRVQDVTTSSVIAHRFFEEGLRSFAVADYRAAERLFGAAFAEDTTFAMAFHYMLLNRIYMQRDVSLSEQRKLMRLASRATDRERLLIRAMLTTLTNERGLGAVAETLTARYPTEPDGHYWVGVARANAGDPLGAISDFRRVVAMDSLGLSGKHARCRACDALVAIANAYMAADSARAAERVAREWLRLQPNSAAALNQLAGSLEAQDRSVEALAVTRRAVMLSPGQPYDLLRPVLFRIRVGDFENADPLLEELARSGTDDEAREALWFLAISLRYQGRQRDALRVATELENQSRGSGTAAAQMRAQILLEMGRFMEAAVLFDSIAKIDWMAKYKSTNLARHRAWNLSHRANALAAVGDTVALKAVIDTIYYWGNRSGFGRDWRLHHHARGLLLARRGRYQEAADEFRRAIYSPTVGYTRTNLELARMLLALNRPNEAVTTLRAALRGGLEASNLYVTRTDLHELLGQAWATAGQADSARVQYQRVVNAWRNADPYISQRRAAVEKRLAALR